jgi:subtilisin family serine protease
MKRLAIIVAVISCFLAVSVRVSGQNGHNWRSGTHQATYVTGELLVKYKPAVRAAAAGYFRSRLGIYTIKNFRKIGVQHVKLPKNMSVEEALEVYRSDPDVEYVEPNYYRYATAIPNDSFFSNLWGLNNVGDTDIDAPEAWDITQGNSNVVVAVIDSGVDYDHPDLAANIWANSDEQIGDANSDGFPGVQGVDDDGDGLIDEDSQYRQPGDPGYINDLADDDDENGYVDDIRGWDFVDEDNDPIDSDDHGTHVAGTAAAVGNNNIGITGVSWTAKIMPLRFLNAYGSGSVADGIDAIDYAIDKGANIINASYGSYTFSAAERDAISRARNAGILFVAAAGNDSWNNDSATKHYPSSYDLNNIIAVAATDQNDSRAFFSNYGATSVDVAAPGANIFSSRPGRQTVWSDNFDDGDIATDWATGGTNNFWDVTTEYGRSGSYSLTDYPNNNYLDGTDSWAQTQVIDLSSHVGSKLTFWLRGGLQSNDYFFVQGSSDGNIWTNLTLEISGSLSIFWTGSTSSFVKATADLGSYDGINTFYLRFNFHSDSDANVAEGWFFDDVEVSAAASTYLNPQDQYYQYFNGTSMATPHVSGLAALLLADDPGLSAIQVKERILNGVEVKSGLAGMILTGGRINAYNSIRSVPAPPSSLSAAATSSSRINLTWSDSSYGEDGFKIERKTGAGGIYSQIAVTPANTTSYADTGLDELTTYHYQVSAYVGINSSDFSASTSATTSEKSGGGGGGGGCFIVTAGFGSHFNCSAHFIGEHQSAKIVSRWMPYPFLGLDYIALHTTVAQRICFGLAFIAIPCFITFRRRCRS